MALDRVLPEREVSSISGRGLPEKEKRFQTGKFLREFEYSDRGFLSKRFQGFYRQGSS
jgi:hypothetical protein